jgi:hypothetical protein
LFRLRKPEIFIKWCAGEQKSESIFHGFKWFSESVTLSLATYKISNEVSVDRNPKKLTKFREVVHLISGVKFRRFWLDHIDMNRLRVIILFLFIYLCQNQFLSTHVCKATTYDYEKRNKKLKLFLIFENKIPKKLKTFFSLQFNFNYLLFYTKTWSKLYFSIDFRAFGSRESMWISKIYAFGPRPMGDVYFLYHILQKLLPECWYQKNVGHLKFTLPCRSRFSKDQIVWFLRKKKRSVINLKVQNSKVFTFLRLNLYGRHLRNQNF